jgi:chromosome partitioning protein
MDPQGNASRWLGAPDASRELLEVLIGERNLVDIIRPTAAKGVDVVPSSTWLRRADKELADEPGAEMRFRRALAKLPRRWDVILVDTSPWLGLLTISVLAACREVLIPVEASTLSTEGLRDFMLTIDKVREGLNTGLRTLAIVPGRVDERRAIDLETVESVRRHFPGLVTRIMVHESALLKEAAANSQPIEQYAPASRAAQEFRDLVAAHITRKS